ncbi:MAG: tetratricopeptide repeat protein [Pyrinomonadaceae bacterium]
MSQRSFLKFATLLTFGFYLVTVAAPARIQAQTGDNLAELKKQIRVLTDQNRFTEALPLLEKLAAAEPDNAETHFYLGFALVAQANATVDDRDRKALRARARSEFIRSKNLGNSEPLVEAMIGSMAADGSEGPDFSKNIGAHLLMVKAESFFSQGQMEEALRNYQKALILDPTLYEAALFSGDVFSQKGDFAQAEVWYQKAISVDPNRETAYRYSATPLMKQRKYDEARDRYVEAFITEPYNRFTVVGLTNWSQATNTVLAHPRIEIPTTVTFDDKGDAKINLDGSVLLGGKDDGSFAWISYGATRSLWHKEKFAKTFPNELSYRHSLAEEADALRSVITMATADKKTKTLSPALAKLKKLNDEGLLEAFILMAQPTEGIAKDHPAYIKENRDKLRRYVVTYVIKGGGN